MALEKLSVIERKFAEENHNLIYGFLHKHGYSIEDFYSLAVFGYLTAVQAYHRTEINGKYGFSYTAYSYMKTEIKDHFKMENRQKRTAEKSVSLESEEENGNLHETTGGKSAEDSVMEKLTAAMLVQNLTETQKGIMRLKLNGYNNMQTMHLMGIPSASYYKEVGKIKQTIDAIGKQNGRESKL